MNLIWRRVAYMMLAGMRAKLVRQWGQGPRWRIWSAYRLRRLLPRRIFGCCEPEAAWRPPLEWINVNAW